jgi:O-antigen ligase/polysaccharide polymerase Wzy-like membrane protein
MTAIASSVPATSHDRVNVRGVIVGYVALIVLLLVAHRAALLQVVVPAGGAAVAIWVYRNASFAIYATLAWWFWFVAPGLRRVVDYQAGAWNPENLISLAPLLVTAVAALTVLRRLPELQRRRLWPFAAAALCITYGFFVGLLRNGPLAAIHALLSWLVPLLFGLAIALEWRRYPELSRRISRAFVWSGILLSLYAVFQFLNPPAWDRFWVDNAGMASVGFAFPYRLRVFSLMNGPLLFGVMLLAALFLAFASKGGWRIVALVAATVALLLTLVRSVWLVVLLGGVVYLYALPLRSARRAAVVAVAAISLLWTLVALLPADLAAPVVTMVEDRAMTLGSLNQDLSYSQRAGFMDQITGAVLESPVGHGLGSTGVSSTLGEPADAGIKDFDNGVFAVLYSLGWFAGAALLALGGYIVILCLPRRESRSDTVAKAARAIVVAMLALNLGNNTFDGLAGMVFWGFAGLLVASHQWHAASAQFPLNRVRA